MLYHSIGLSVAHKRMIIERYLKRYDIHPDAHYNVDYIIMYY